MAAYLKVENRLVTCPYDEAHKVKESRLQLHIAKCKLNHLDNEKDVCPFNATHLFDRSERDFHLLNCPDKAPLDRKLAQSLDKNNPFKGRCAVPSYSESRPVYSDECWDDEISDSGPGYVPKAAPPGAIIEPRPMAKPAERRAMYEELHRLHSEPEKPAKNPPAKPITPRQPKEESEVQRQQIAAKEQRQNVQAIQNLGLGRGKATRIAANIFDNPQNRNAAVNNVTMSQVVNGFNNLGLGRGSNNNAFVSPLDDDDEFPALGCGRGAFRGQPKQTPRAPGTKHWN